MLHDSYNIMLSKAYSSRMFCVRSRDVLKIRDWLATYIMLTLPLLCFSIWNFFFSEYSRCSCVYSHSKLLNFALLCGSVRINRMSRMRQEAAEAWMSDVGGRVSTTWNVTSLGCVECKRDPNDVPYIFKIVGYDGISNIEYDVVWTVSYTSPNLSINLNSHRTDSATQSRYETYSLSFDS